MKKPTVDENGFHMFRGLFNELYVEINEMKKKKPDDIVNAFKVERINRILIPICEFMKDEPYSAYLETIPTPTEEMNGRIAKMSGLSYSDVMILLSQYRSGMNQFNHKYFYSPITIGISDE